MVFKNNFLIACVKEMKNQIEFYDFYGYKRTIDSFNFCKEDYINLYEFIFSNYINKLFLKRTKPITYIGIMKYALKVDKELKEYFKKIIQESEQI